ncbi:glycosyltransferase family 39 protein [Streptococcus suis]|uniref:glycosyltransferase family 39 protein n=1 Tax=Streptococcus suis TaxID=1307 RepID=UPI0021195988|nr:glycosyltransferase family 39 protein [Streptococcus suis]
MTELDTTSENATNKGKYRRQRKNSQSQELNLDEEFNDKLLDTKIWPAIIWSLLLSIFSVANPFLTSFATNIQTQNLYAGMAMMFGQVPYGNFFGTNGVLYYLLAWLGHIDGGFLVFGLLQFIFLVIAGIYFYKIIAYFGQSDYLATSFSHWFYIFIFALGFGGLYAEIFVLPFILMTIWFLVRYFENAIRDEGFILYGINLALTFLIYPKGSILWLVASLVLLVFNIRNQQKARGIYQFLATVFGFLLVMYVVGYYAFDSEILGSAIQQTFLYNLRLDFQYTDLYLTIAMVSGFLLLSGFFKSMVQTLISFGQGKHTYIKIILLLAFLVQLLFIVGTDHFYWSYLLNLVPYGFVMGIVHLQDDSVDEEDSYLRLQFFLPLFICLGIFAQPAYAYLLQGELVADRENVAQYVSEQTEEADKIYVWDNSASIYLDSQRLSSATITTITPYLNTTENKNSLIYDLNKNDATYVVVNKNLPILDEVKTNLESQYKSVQTTDHFIIYQKNE